MSNRNPTSMIRRAIVLLGPVIMLGGLGTASSDTASARQGSDPAIRAAVATVRDLIERDAWQDALATARSAAETGGDDPDVRTALGEALYRAGEIEEAETVLERAVESFTDPPARALLVLGLIRAAQARYDECLRLMNRALEMAPDDPYILYWASGIQESRADAIRTLERFLGRSDGQDPDRIEGVEGTLRLYRALGDRQVWVRESVPTRMETPLREMWNDGGEIAGYAIDVQLGEKRKPVRLMLDSGSPGLFVVDRTARKRGFQALSEETTFGGGGSGRHRSQRGLFGSFALGELRFRDALASTSPSAIDPFSRYRGLVGIAPFEGFRVVLDLADNRLVLESVPEEAQDGGAPYWAVAGQLLIRVDAESGSSGLFLLDTGASRTLLDLAFVRTVKGASVGAEARIHAYGGLRPDARRVDGVVLGFLGATTDEGPMNAVDLTVRSRLTGIQISGFLGLDLFRGTKVVIDTVHRRVYVERPRRPR